MDKAQSHDKNGDALDRLADVHRGWCNYCKGDPVACLNAPAGGCALRDYMLSLSAPSHVRPIASPRIAELVRELERKPINGTFKTGSLTVSLMEAKELLSELRGLLTPSAIATPHFIGVDQGRPGGDHTGYVCSCGQIRVEPDGPCERKDCPIRRADGSNQGGAAGRTGPKRHSLQAMAKHNLWPTPQAHDKSKGNAKRVGRYGTKHGGRNLNDWVAMWPTPTARDHRSGVNHNCWYNARPLSEVVGGLLNPEWVEWLMGYPQGHTELAPSEMPSSRISLKRSAGQSCN